MAPRKGLVLAPIALILTVVLLVLGRPLQFHGSFNRHGDGATSVKDGAAPTGARRRLQLNDPTDMPPPAAGWESDRSGYGYAVLLVSYRTADHDMEVEADLVDYLISSFPGAGPSVTEYGTKSAFRQRWHQAGGSGCARVHVISGTISVQHAPDLFCQPERLAKLLLDDGSGHREEGLDRGVKVVHLVRNPFSMAVSNYHHIARSPPPEPWVRGQNPCNTLYDRDESRPYADMVLPALFKTRYEALGIDFGSERLVSRGEFDAIVDDCLSLYQTDPKLQGVSFLGHLVNYDAPEGLRLATAEMTVQGYLNGGDVLRMANNMVKLKQAQMMVKRSDDYQSRGKELEVYTMSLDDLAEAPGMFALEFFDFVLGKQNPDVSQMERQAAAIQYQRHYLAKEMSRQATQGRAHNEEQLKEYLRHDPVFGPTLGKIELLVQTVLEESRNNGDLPVWNRA